MQYQILVYNRFFCFIYFLVSFAFDRLLNIILNLIPFLLYLKAQSKQKLLFNSLIRHISYLYFIELKTISFKFVFFSIK